LKKLKKKRSTKLKKKRKLWSKDRRTYSWLITQAKEKEKKLMHLKRIYRRLKMMQGSKNRSRSYKLIG